jgi:uncharacterized protein YbaP (TraB family)
MSIRMILCLRLFIGAILLIKITTSVGAQECPARPWPLEQARDYIDKTPAKNAGLLWRVEKSGRASWLYGTMHLMHIDYAKPGPQIMMGMRSSDVLAVEINLYEPQQPLDTSLIQKFEVSNEQHARLQSAYQKECIKEYPAHPALNLLMISQANRQGLFDGYGPDARLMQIAKRMNKPIVQLESLEQQIKALMPRSQVEFSEQVNSSLKFFESGALFSSLGELAKAWQRNDFQTFVQHSERMEKNDPAFVRRLNDERNILMAGKIDGLHTDGKRVFVAVGAFHMTGKHGIPKLLEEKGYTVTFVPLKNGNNP